MRIALAALFVLAAGAFADIAKADPYRSCADYGVGRSGLGATNCYFLTLEQCRAAVSGVGGYCTLNQFYDGVPLDGQPRRKKRAAR